MARSKSKKSRRTRRLESEKQKLGTAVAQPVTSDLEALPEVSAEPVAVEAVPTPEFRRKDVNFAKEYFHVYTELRNIMIIAAVMFIIMIGALYLI